MPTKFTELTEEELREANVKILESLLDAVKSGVMVFRGHNRTQKYVRVYDNETEKWEHFKIGGGTIGFIFETPDVESVERARLDQYMKDHPKAEVVNRDW